MIEVKHLCLDIGAFSLREVALRIESNEYFVLLGPTGSGKSLLLKCICGLLRIKSGSILIDGQDVTDREPRLREVGYVPQDAGLFPHMTVEQNVLFSLRVRGVPRRERLGRVSRLIDLLNLSPLLKRSPAGLSGGERQKVALARALAIRPKLLLLDEPVSALDEPTRQQVCEELRRVQRELRVATIHVSHNTEEALAVSDRAGILCEGRLIQAAPMVELLRRPKNEIAARFLRSENIFRGKAVRAPDGRTLIRFAGHEIYVAPPPIEGDVTFAIRPESVRLCESVGPSPNTFEAILVRITDRGAYQRLEFAAGVPIVVYAPVTGLPDSYPLGRKLTLHFPPEAIHILGE
ncbi:MAG: ABC transporter ATP-binding protein [Planctomycetota bacterium]